MKKVQKFALNFAYWTIFLILVLSFLAIAVFGTYAVALATRFP